jgi:DNA-3-methyladenine glycosylase I
MKQTLSEPVRCAWAQKPLNIPYHDKEWGVPVHDDRVLFEFLILEGAQAGLSWDTILQKRARYREVFDHFDPQKVARYNARKVKSLLEDPGIVRNRLKVASASATRAPFSRCSRSLAASTRTSGDLWTGFHARMPGSKLDRCPPAAPSRMRSARIS